MGLVVLIVGLASATCLPEAAEAGAVERAIVGADAAIAALDPQALTAAAAALHDAIACQPTPISPAEAAAIHRVEGISAFVAGDELAASAWLTASRTLDPRAGLGHDIGGPLQTAWDRALTRSPADTRPVPAPATGEIRIDGAAATTAPAHLPVVFQWTDAGTVRASALVPAEAAFPPYPLAAPARRGRPFAIAVGGGAVVSIATLSAAAALRRQFLDPDRPYDEVAGLVAPNRVLGGVGVGVAVATVGVGVAAVLSGAW